MADRSLTLTFLGKDVSAAATAEALAAKLRALEAAQDDNTRASDKLSKSLKDTHDSGFKPLLDTAVLLGPALLPIAAGAVAAGVGLAALGVTAIAAFKGIQAEIENNTALGAEYQTAFKPIVDEWQQLQHIAAAGVFTGLDAGIKASAEVFPQLNTAVAELSTHLGNIAGNVGATLVNAFQHLEPLFGTLADQLDRGSASLLRWSQSGTSIDKFVSIAQSELPKVEHLLGDVATAIGHIVAAAGPLGGVALQAIDNLANAISRIPVPVLTGLLAALQVSRLAAIASSLTSLGSGLTSAASGLGAFITAGEGAIPVVGALVVGVGLLASKTQDAVPQLGININQLGSTIGKLDSDYSKGVEQFGQTITNAFEQGGTAAYDLTAQAALAATQLGPVNTALMATGQSVQSFAQTLQGSDSDWRLFIQNVNDGLRAMGEGPGAIKALDGQLQQLRDAFLQGKITGEQYNTALAAMGVTAAGTANGLSGLTVEQQKAAAAAQAQKQATDELITSLDKLQSQSLNAAQIELNFKAALDGAKQQVQQQKGAMLDNTAAGRANQSWLLTQIGTINQHAQAVYKATGSTSAMTGALQSDEAQLIKTAGAAGFNTGKVQELINKYADVPPNVSTYLKTIDGASGVIQNVNGQLTAIDGRIVYTTIETQHLDIYTVQDAASNRGPAGVTSRAVGGLLNPGWNLVGEGGPELIKYSASSARVYTAGDTAKMLGGGSTYVVNIRVDGSVASERDLVTAVRAGIRDQLRSEGKTATVI